MARIADSIRPALSSVFAGETAMRIELSETFEAWRFEGVVDSAAVVFSMRTRFEGRYHHQIKVNDRPAGYAVSTHVGDGLPWRLARLAPSKISHTIDETLDLLESVASDATVRLLEAPDYALTAFWLVEPSLELLYVIACPAYLTMIERSVFMSPTSFVAMLARQPL